MAYPCPLARCASMAKRRSTTPVPPTGFRALPLNVGDRRWDTAPLLRHLFEDFSKCGELLRQMYRPAWLSLELGHGAFDLQPCGAPFMSSIRERA